MAKKSVKMNVESVSIATNSPERIIAKRSAEEEAKERKWRAERALEDIERAEKHRGDKSLMKDVKQCAKEKMRAYGKL